MTMHYLLLFTSVIFAVTKTLLARTCEQRNIFLFNTFNFIAALITLALFSIGGDLSVSWYSLIIAVIYAIFTLISHFLLMTALKMGDIGITSLIYYCTFIIPTVFSAIVWKESFGVMKIIGVLLILVSFIIGVEKKGGKGGKLWLALALLSMTCAGVIGITQKIFAKSAHSNELNSMLMINFAILILASLLIHLFYERKRTIETEWADKSKLPLPKKELIASVIMGVTIALANKINTYLPSVMDGVIFFPVLNGGSIILGAIGGIIFFKEKVYARKVISLVVGVVAIALTVI